MRVCFTHLELIVKKFTQGQVIYQNTPYVNSMQFILKSTDQKLHIRCRFNNLYKYLTIKQGGVLLR